MVDITIKEIDSMGQKLNVLCYDLGLDIKQMGLCTALFSGLHCTEASKAKVSKHLQGVSINSQSSRDIEAFGPDLLR